MSGSASALLPAVHESAWNEMLDEFRALGGTAENVCLRVGPLGRGLFPRDPKNPVILQIPENLLVRVEDFVLQDGAIRIRPETSVGTRERAFLERYENEFSWGAGGRAEVEDFLSSVRALPGPLREFFADRLGQGEWFGDISPEFLLRRFMDNRVIDYGDRTVVMPLIELANHGQGAGYQREQGILLSGVFPGEVLVTYTVLDPIQMFLQYGFASPEPLAFSMNLNLKKGATELQISREFANKVRTLKDWVLIPAVSTGGNEVKLSFLLIGSKRTPRVPKGIFYRLMRDVFQAETEETFDLVQHLNRGFFFQLMEILEEHEGPMIRTVRSAVRFQLEAMSHCYGVREI